MSTLFKNANSPIWRARYHDRDGKRVSRTTGTKSKREARRIAEGFEAEETGHKNGAGRLSAAGSTRMELASSTATSFPDGPITTTDTTSGRGSRCSKNPSNLEPIPSNHEPQTFTIYSWRLPTRSPAGTYRGDRLAAPLRPFFGDVWRLTPRQRPPRSR
jgi:hypothetical protein